MKEMVHVGLVVKDSARSATFYTQVLECIVSGDYQDERVKIIFLKSGTGMIELVQYLNGSYEPRGTGIVDHLAFQVKNLEEEVLRLKKLNVPLLWETPRQVLGEKRAIFFSGPDGEKIEFIEEKN